MTIMQREDENSSIEAGSLEKCDLLIAGLDGEAIPASSSPLVVAPAIESRSYRITKRNRFRSINRPEACPVPNHLILTEIEHTPTSAVRTFFTMSTETASGLRQRSCKRVACTTTLPVVGSRPSGNCCDGKHYTILSDSQSSQMPNYNSRNRKLSRRSCAPRMQQRTRPRSG